MTGRSGIVLAGGRSRRFGSSDKAVATLGGDPLLVRVVDRVSTVVDEVVVSCRSAQVDPFEQVLSSPAVDCIVEDRIADGGPLAGLEAGFDAVSEPYTAVVACDMPFVEPAVLRDLFERATGVDAVVPELADGQLQPVQAVYRSRAMRTAIDQMGSDGGSIHSALESLAAVTVPAESFPERSFHNVNTRRDLVVAERRAEENR